MTDTQTVAAIIFFIAGSIFGFGITMLLYRRMLLETLRICSEYSKITQDLLNRLKL